MRTPKIWRMREGCRSRVVVNAEYEINADSAMIIYAEMCYMYIRSTFFFSIPLWCAHLSQAHFGLLNAYHLIIKGQYEVVLFVWFYRSRFFFKSRIIYEISTVNVFSLKLPVSTHNFTEYGLEISLQFYVEHHKNTLLNVDC